MAHHPLEIFLDSQKTSRYRADVNQAKDGGSMAIRWFRSDWFSRNPPAEIEIRLISDDQDVLR